MDINERIERFEALVAEDPTNDMARFSLGGSYNQAGRYAEAAEAYKACIELNPTMSKAYQLAGAALIAADKAGEAGDLLEKGYVVAAEQGDLMPKNAMAELLTNLGRPLPKVEKTNNGAPPPDGSFICARTGKPGTKMAKPPFRGGVGEWIGANIAKETFDEWIGLGTKIINELRLDLSNDEHDAVYDYAMRRFLGLSDEKIVELSGKQPPQPTGEYRDVVDQILGRMGQLEEFGGEMHRQVGS